MDDAEKVSILNGIGPGSTPQEPLALVAKMSDSERRALDSEGRSGFASGAVYDTTSPEIQYLYYLLYGVNYEMPSKVAFDREEPALGRIRVDFIAPPHSPASIIRCISRVKRNQALALPGHANLFADTSCDTPFKEGHISFLHTDGPGLSPNEPMAIVQVKKLSIPDGKYVIKNRAVAHIYWCAGAAASHNSIKTVHFYSTTMDMAKKHNFYQWDISQDADGNISMTSQYNSSLWVGADMSGSTVPVPWRVILVDSKFYYLTTDTHYSLNPWVPVARQGKDNDPGSMTSLKEGDQWQMWEFIRIYNY